METTAIWEAFIGGLIAGLVIGSYVTVLLLKTLADAAN